MDPEILKKAAFAPIDYDGWRKLVERVLKGKSFDETLVSHTDDSLRIEPIYPRAAAKAQPRIDGTAGWHVVQRIDHRDPAAANAQANDDIAGGAGGLALVFAGAPNAFGYGLPPGPETVARVLDGISPETVHLRIDTHPDSRRSVEWMVEYLSRQRINPTRLSLSFGIDPAALFGGTGRLRMSIEALRASMPQSLAGFLALDIPGVLLEADGRVYHNAGASEAQELGAMLSAAVAHMRMVEEARQPVVYASPRVGFSLSVDHDLFLSLAKIRALRLLWAKVQEACSIEPSPTNVHAETSWRMMAARDPETNILRNTIAAFAAAAGGADSIAVIPHTAPHGLPDPLARRIARNTQRILVDESHIGFVADPAGGAGSFENLTDSLCEAAWREFQKIESEGGILESLRDGHLQGRILQKREARAKEIASGRLPIVGTTLHPLAQEEPTATLAAERLSPPEDGLVFCQRLVPVRNDEFAGEPT
jgi:methylmalonyl-CoA mutase